MFKVAILQNRATAEMMAREFLGMRVRKHDRY